jgi:Tol biopolymer transport system component
VRASEEASKLRREVQKPKLCGLSTENNRHLLSQEDRIAMKTQPKPISIRRNFNTRSLGALTALALAFVTLTTSLVPPTKAAQPFNTYLGQFRTVEARSNHGSTSPQNFINHALYGNVYTGLRWECVEYMRRFYLSALNFHITSSGNGNEWYGLAPNIQYKDGQTTRIGFDRFPDDSVTRPPASGDILAYDSSVGGGFGHVAIIKRVRPGYLLTAQENWANESTDLDRRLTLTSTNSRYNVGDGGVQGWLRPRCTPRTSSSKWHPNGSLLMEPSGAVWFIEYDPVDQRQEKRLVPDEWTFVTRGWSWCSLIAVTTEELLSYPTGPNVGNSERVIRRPDGAIFRVNDRGYKQVFISLRMFDGLGYSMSEVEQASSNAAVDQIPDEPAAPRLTAPFPEGTLVRNGSDQTVWIITDGGRRPFGSAEAFQLMGYDFNRVLSIDNNTFIEMDSKGSPIDVCTAMRQCDQGGSPDEIGPNLSITSHTNNQTVTTSSITLSGTATDNGRGESGISSVTVNGTRASGDTATGSNTANWSINLALNSGSNQITVQARDASPDQNLTQQTLTINRSTGGCSSSSISPGQTPGGSLTTSDCKLSGTNRYYDVYSFNGVAGQQVSASMDSSSFDTYLYLTNSNNQVLAEDNNSGPGTNSRIVGLSGYYTPPSTGIYFLWASSATDNATGSYTVGLSQCAFDLSTSSMSVGPGNGGGAFLIDTSSGCAWSAVSDSTSWLTTTSNGSGDGRIEFTFTANNSTNPRTGRITVGGQVCTVTQIGIGGAGSVQFSSASYSVNEATSEVTITVTRQGGTESGTVNYATSDGTATAGVDYIATSGLLLFGQNQTSKSFNVTILNDSVFEGNESINLSLSNQSTSLTLGNPSTATLMIIEDDSSPTPTPTPSPTPPSPATKIAFTRGINENAEIYSMNADGSGQLNLTNNSVNDEYPTWSPDKSKIAFVSWRDGNKEIYVMNGDGSNQHNITNHYEYDLDPSWSPDGSKIAFHSYRDGNAEIYVMNADGSNPTRLTYSDQTIDSEATWSPDGSKIAFQRFQNFVVDIYVINTDGSNLRNLTNYPGQSSKPCWSPDGTKIAFSRDGLYLMNADGSNQTNITGSSFNGGDPSWSPDGMKIAFRSSRDGNDEIYVMNSDGTNQTRLTNSSDSDYDPAWGPPAVPNSAQMNYALAANGGVASASSTTPNSQIPGYNFLPAVTIDGDRRGGVNFWRDDTADAYPDWLQVDFNGNKNITQIDVITVQDNNDQNPLEPTSSMTFSLHGITAFEVQYWTGSAWITVPNGSVTGNNKVWRQFTFSPITTSKVRVLVNNALNTRTRIVELEAY